MENQPQPTVARPSPPRARRSIGASKIVTRSPPVLKRQNSCPLLPPTRQNSTMLIQSNSKVPPEKWMLSPYQTTKRTGSPLLERRVLSNKEYSPRSQVPMTPTSSSAHDDSCSHISPVVLKYPENKANITNSCFDVHTQPRSCPPSATHAGQQLRSPSPPRSAHSNETSEPFALGWPLCDYESTTDEDDIRSNNNVSQMEEDSSMDEACNEPSPMNKIKHDIDSEDKGSHPVSPQMDLIYSASGSTSDSTSHSQSTIATPSWHVRDEAQDEETPVICNTTSRAQINSSSPASISSQENHGSRRTTDKSSNPSTTKDGWTLPKVNTFSDQKQNIDHTSHSVSSTLSLPSLLGGASIDVSELESPIVADLQTTAEESDIQSESQATDIVSLQTITPVHSETFSTAAPMNWIQTNPKANSLPKNHHKSSADIGAREDKLAQTPTLCEIASGSGFCLSEAEFVAAVAADDDVSETISDDISATSQVSRLSHSHAIQPVVSHITVNEASKMLPIASMKSINSFANTPRLSRFFFGSSNCTPSPTVKATFLQEQGNASDNLSKRNDLPGDVEPSEFSSRGEFFEETSNMDDLIGVVTDDVEYDEESILSKLYGRSRCGFIVRLCVVLILALAVIVPLVVVLIYTRDMNAHSDGGGGASQPWNSTDVHTPTLPPFTLKTAAPTTFPTRVPTVAPTHLEQVPKTPSLASEEHPSSAPAISSTDSTDPPSLTLNVTEWKEEAWNLESNQPGLLWPSTGNVLHLSILNSLDDDTNENVTAVLDEVVEDWTIDRLTFSIIEITRNSSEYSTSDCDPEVGYIRVCNGNYGYTNNQVSSFLYLDESEIIAATILVNDDHESQTSEATLRQSLCHHFGHILGVSHSTRGCMHATNNNGDPTEQEQDIYLHPDPWSLAELQELYELKQVRQRRLLRSSP